MKSMPPPLMSQTHLDDHNNRQEEADGEAKKKEKKGTEKTFLLPRTVDQTHPGVSSGKLGLLY